MRDLNLSSLEQFFTNSKGLGILSTASSSGEPNAALYAKPRFFDNGTIGFIMLNKKTVANIRQNPKACYLFAKDGHYKEGVRLYLELLDLIEDDAKIAQLTGSNSQKTKFLALFKITKSLQIASDKEFPQV